MMISPSSFPDCIWQCLVPLQWYVAVERVEAFGRQVCKAPGRGGGWDMSVALLGPLQPYQVNYGKVGLGNVEKVGMGDKS